MLKILLDQFKRGKVKRYFRQHQRIFHPNKVQDKNNQHMEDEYNEFDSTDPAKVCSVY